MFRPETLLYCICLAAWIYLLSVLKRNRLTAFRFMAGSVGFFTFAFLAFRSALTKACSAVLIWILSLAGRLLGYYEVYGDYYMLFIDSPKGSVSLLIDYECCGVIEELVVLSIVLFFPSFTALQKAAFSAIGMAYTMAVNATRLLAVSWVIYQNGSGSYYISHAVVGRIVFYLLILFLYFYLFSYNQIKRQKIGSFEYKEGGG